MNLWRHRGCVKPSSNHKGTKNGGNIEKTDGRNVERGCYSIVYTVVPFRFLIKVALKPYSWNIQLYKLRNSLFWLSQLEIHLTPLAKKQFLTIRHLLKMQFPWPGEWIFNRRAEKFWIFNQGPKWFSCRTRVRDWIVYPPNSHVEILTPSASECGCMWR